MVRALLDGSKTQTRRVMKPQPIQDARFVGGWKVVGKGGEESATCSPLIADKSPYGQPGDQLWVRETWAYGTHALASKNHEREGPWVYAADGDTALQGRLCDRWRPSIHMFQSASRITLEITGVRVERLQHISEKDARAEGVIVNRSTTSSVPNDAEIIHQDERGAVWSDGLRRDNLAREAYADLWDSLNAKSRPTLPANTASKRYARVKQWLDTHPDTTSWDANPWVWVIEFKRLKGSTP